MKDKFSLLHFALYAKHWYAKSGDIWYDLKKLMIADNYSGDHMSKSDIVSVILTRCQDLNIQSFSLLAFASGIAPENGWKIDHPWKGHFPFMNPEPENLPEYDQQEAIVRYCLSVICNLERSQFSEELPRPDKKVLPLKKGILKKDLDKIFGS